MRGLRAGEKVFKSFSWAVRAPTEGLAEIRLRITVDQEHSSTYLSQHRAEVCGRGRSRDAPLMVGEHDDHAFCGPHFVVFTSFCLAVCLLVGRYVLGAIKRGGHGDSFPRGCQLSENRPAGAAIRSCRDAWACMCRAGARTGSMCPRATELAQRSRRPGSRMRRRQGGRPGGPLPGVTRRSGTGRWCPARGTDRGGHENARGNGEGTTSHRQGPELARVDPLPAGRGAAPDQPIPLLTRAEMSGSERRGGDSNPRWTDSPYRFSRPAHSTALPPLRGAADNKLEHSAQPWRMGRCAFGAPAFSAGRRRTRAACRRTRRPAAPTGPGAGG